MIYIFFFIFLISFSTTMISVLVSLSLFSVLNILHTSLLLRVGEHFTMICVAFLIGYAVQVVTGKYQGSVWNIKISESGSVKAFRIFGIIGGILSIILIVIDLEYIINEIVLGLCNIFIGLFQILFSGDTSKYFATAIDLFVKITVILMGFIGGFKFAGKSGLKIYRFSSDLMKLGQTKILSDIDKYINNTEKIFIDGTEIVLSTYDKSEMHFIYENYGLPKLHRIATAAESKKVADFSVGFVGLYFAKKYKDLFKFYIRKELIRGDNGSPGTLVKIVGPSGVYYASIGETSSIPDKKVFNGYEFVRTK